MFDLERAFLEGDGARVGRLLLDGEKKYMGPKSFGQLLGERLPFGLLQMAQLAPDSALFQPPW